MSTTATKGRGPSGSVRGIPEPEVTALLLTVVTKLAKGGLTFTRLEATKALAAEGVAGGELDGVLFALARTIPGLTSVGFGKYELPKDWRLATKHRMLRLTLPKLNVLEAKELLELLDRHEPDGAPPTIVEDGVVQLRDVLADALS